MRSAARARDLLVARLSRETSSGHFIPEMDGLRFVAIAMVILFHLNGYLVAKWPLHHAGSAPQSGWLAQTALVGFRGVELFFVISGFILALPFAAHHISGAPRLSLRKYYLRRLTRLEPPYFGTLFVPFALGIWVQEQAFWQQLPHLGASFFYLHNLIYGSASSVVGVAWSLEIEVQFYLLVPLLTLVFAVRSVRLRRGLLLGLVSLILTVQFLTPPGGRAALSILAYLQFFLIGFLLADIFLADWRESPTTHLYWDVVGVIGWPLLMVVLQSDWLEHWLFPFMLLMLCCAAFRGRLTRRVICNRWLTIIGGMCYSIYLIHYEVISAVGRFTRQLGSDLPYWEYLSVQFVLIGAAIVVMCGLYFAVLEKPCMRRDWPQRLRSRWQSLWSRAASAPELAAGD
jgi:peptidoglycan/LPS O-acetylase OafA/YrhL